MLGGGFEGGGGSFETGRPRTRGWKNFGKTRGWGVLKIGHFSWMSYAYHPFSYLTDRNDELRLVKSV